MPSPRTRGSTFSGTEIDIYAFAFPAHAGIDQPIAAELAAGDIAGALMRHADAVIEATAIGAGVERAWLEDQTPDVLAVLAAKVLEVNADFFVRRVLPVIQGAADRLTQSAQTASGGTSGSPPSSMPDSATGT